MFKPDIKFNKTDLFKLFAFVFLGSFLIVSAYSNPPASGNTDVFPIYTDATPQDKKGGLSVNTFTANENAGFAQDVYFEGNVTGNDSFFPPRINIGGGSPLSSNTYPVNLTTIGSVTSDTLVMEILKSPSDTSLRQIAADSNGRIIVYYNPAPVLSVQILPSIPGEYEIIWSASDATSCSGNYNGFDTYGATSGDSYITASYGSSFLMNCTGPGGTTEQRIYLN